MCRGEHNVIADSATPNVGVIREYRLMNDAPAVCNAQ